MGDEWVLFNNRLVMLWCSKCRAAWRKPSATRGVRRSGAVALGSHIPRARRSASTSRPPARCSSRSRGRRFSWNAAAEPVGGAAPRRRCPTHPPRSRLQRSARPWRRAKPETAGGGLRSVQEAAHLRQTTAPYRLDRAVTSANSNAGTCLARPWRERGRERAPAGVVGASGRCFGRLTLLARRAIWPASSLVCFRSGYGWFAWQATHDRCGSMVSTFTSG